ncbi:hypothetical protein NC653_012055 [Populus alba x Populus x berolinensis]|uniref:DUF659 domain-containing protein n=1 Tax=Populus alba x Populus x berolinensis TaxID=444605 RepID=A0AAD6R3U0_9ROSI|nr:hypothetical protein NC653_012055 [Populus alba x Populus x berolinensis]
MGPGFKGPSYHDLREPLLKGVVHDVHEYLFEIKADWKLYGCSIMANGWSNRRNVPIVNFLAYSPRALMRKDFTNGNDLCRPSITRFATHFLSIQCLLKFKKELRQMFTCMKWVESSHGKSKVGKEITAIILQDKYFWPRCEHIVKVSEPLVQVLRLANSEEKPAMGYLYEAMDKEKEAIKTRLKNRVSQYGPYIRVIDARWDKQLHNPLHAAGCFLNPGIYFRPSFSKQKEVTRGLLSTITRLVPDCDTQDVISGQLEEYKKATGDFGMPLAIRQREKLNPGNNIMFF